MVDRGRVEDAVRGLAESLGRDHLRDVRFLDVGAGSGLSSLAARELGATVRAFDCDPEAVACMRALRERFRPGDPDWVVEHGSVLDEAYLRSLGSYDVVHAWGVLHHTGNLHRAMERVLLPLAPSGTLFVAVYNQQRWLSGAWWAVKRTWVSGWAGRALVGGTLIPLLALRSAASGVIKHGDPFQAFRDYHLSRGMSVVHDWVDWLGGFPFEVARPDDVCRFYRERGLVARRVVTTRSWGCNQFVFTR